ncbi:biopolymer transporter ExbD [Methylomarinum sp. Ch1-1]|uniref:Biopolymer transporter ExbD n=1 Tax=Methylomarinum roseum TaxID=3067653 RepID=A0AAU7NQR9_9GAMM|nr:biopolymer transporter ExbD [Methylomarinum sp. Ch1-1]MDP4520728.1 biopolymer transporter ExbD [Methylomarinum sp. Ch1-1]
MDFHRRKRPPLEISITPMIDVVFLLLIFFMVTTTFNRQTELKVNLPEAHGVESDSKEKIITLMIDEDGTYFLSGDDGKFHQLINQKLSTLKRALSQAAGNSRRIPFVISADGKTPHQAVVSALDIASQLGFKRITFATKSVPTTP